MSNLEACNSATRILERTTIIFRLDHDIHSMQMMELYNRFKEILPYLVNKLAQAACVRHACLRAPYVAWPLFLPSFSLSLFWPRWLACAMCSLAIVITIVQSLLFSFSLSPSFAFDPLRGISCVRKFVSPIFWHS